MRRLRQLLGEWLEPVKPMEPTSLSTALIQRLVVFDIVDA